jgi:hypothetical protein
MEVLSQLGTDGAQEAFSAVHALPRVRSRGLLPWSDDFFRIALFDQPPANSVITAELNRLVKTVLNASHAEDVRTVGEEMRELVDREKNAQASIFSALLDDRRAEGPLPETEQQIIFARSIARQAGMDENSVDVEKVVSRLNAHYIFEKQRMEVGSSTRDYNVRSRVNDDPPVLLYFVLYFFPAFPV